MNYLIIVILFLTIFYFYNEKRKNKGIINIPGPSYLPILGNLLELNGEIHLKLEKWYKEYGPIYRLKFGFIDTVILTEYNTIKEAFIDHQPIFYSRYNRHSRKVLNNLENLLNSNGERHKLLKSMILSELSNIKIKKLEEHLIQETNKLFKLLDKHAESGEPFIINNYLKMYSMNIILRFLFGIGFPYNHLEDSIGIIGAIEDWFYITGVPIMSDFIPLLQYLPDKRMDRMKQLFKIIYKHILEQIETFKKKKTIDGANNNSNEIDSTILDKFLKEYEDGNISEMEMVGTMIDMLTGGTDTSAVTVTFTLFELINNQDIQEKAYSSIKESLLTSPSQDNLEEPVSYSSFKSKIPYLSNCIKESYRKHPAGPLSLPHYTTEDCTINGYNIPKGTMIFQNIYSTHHNEKIWDNPHQYLPSRFENNNTPSLESSLVHFAIGRRCVGSALAESEIFTCLASLIKRYQFINPSPSTPLNVIGKYGLALTPPNNYIVIKKRS